ncbi:hypothetical protein ALC57_14420, partial [Trachymyrmex cornetzi]
AEKLQYLFSRINTCALNLRGRTACRLLDGIEHVEIASVTAWWYQGMSWRQDRETQEHEDGESFSSTQKSSTFVPKNGKRQVPRSDLSLRRQTMILVQRSVSSAYSRSETKPSFDPSGRRQLGTRMYRQRRHATVSHSTDVLSVKWRVNVRRNGSLLLMAFNNSSSCKFTYLYNVGAHRELTLLDPHAAALCVDCRYRQCGMGHIRTTTEAPRPALYSSAVAAWSLPLGSHPCIY